MRRIVCLVVFFIIFGSLIGVLGDKLMKSVPFMYTDENVLYGPGEIRYYKLPSGYHVTGFVESEGNFSVYLLMGENLRSLKAGKDFRAIKSWETQTFIRFNLTIPDKSCYITIKNQGRKHQWIRIEFTARRDNPNG